MIRIYYILIMLLGFSLSLKSQGCSDPGICTIGSLNSGTSSGTVSTTDFKTADFEELLNTAIVAEKYKIGFEAGYGIGEQKTNIYSTILRAGLRIKSKMLIEIKLPFTITQGVLGSANGFGDITLSLQNVFKSGKNYRFAYTLGAVIPSNNANLKSNNKALPMAYQTSLGFFGALGGINFAYKNWNAVIGYQQNFGRNKNEFEIENLITDPSVDGYDTLNRKRLNFLSSRQIKNTGDVILRIERRFQLKKLNVLIGVLPIYRLGNSSVNLTNAENVKIVGSDGLTFNVTGGVNYTFNRNWRMNFNFGAPLINRLKRPDGLTREAIFLVGITRSFW